MEALRVAHLRLRFSPLSETFIYDLVVELERQGIDSRLFAAERIAAGERPFAHARMLRTPRGWSPARVRDRLREQLSRSPHDPWRYLRRALAEGVADFRPHVLHAHFGPEGVIAAPVAAAASVPLVISHHGYDLSLLPRAEVWLRRYAMAWDAAAAVVVVSDAMAEAAARLGCPARKLHVIHVGKDVSRYELRTRRPPVRRFLSVGRLDPKKGFDDAIRAVALLRDRGVDVTLAIVGDGAERDRLRALIRTLRIQDRVQMQGALPHDAVRQQLGAADAFLLCSRTAADGDAEGLPTVLLEAQACGLPCVATRHSGIPEAVPPASRAFLAPEGDIAGIAERMEALVRASAAELDRIAVDGRAWVEERFHLTTEAARLIALYRSISDPAASSAPQLVESIA